MAILTEKGELIVLKDDGKCRTEKQARPLVIKLSQLELRRVYRHNNTPYFLNR